MKIAPYLKTSMIAILFIMLFAACKINPAEKSNNGLSIQIIIADDQYCIHNRIPVKVILKNVGNVPMLIDNNMTLYKRYVPSDGSTTLLIVTDVNGVSLPFFSESVIHPASESDFIILNKNEYISRTVFISTEYPTNSKTRYYNFQPGNIYLANFYYQNSLNFSIVDSSDRIYSWTGTLSVVDSFYIKTLGCNS